jgi:hypothetical protein
MTQPPALPTDHGREPQLAEWENEGGAAFYGSALVRNAPIGIIEAPDDTVPGADKGQADTHTLSVLRLSLLLVVPALGAFVIFWAASVVRV